MKQWEKFITSLNLLKSLMVEGRENAWIASTLFGKGLAPVLSIRCPKKSQGVNDQMRIWKDQLQIHDLKSGETIASNAKDGLEMSCLPLKYCPEIQKPLTGRLNPSNTKRLGKRFLHQRACANIRKVHTV